MIKSMYFKSKKRKKYEIVAKETSKLVIRRKFRGKWLLKFQTEELKFESLCVHVILKFFWKWRAAYFFYCTWYVLTTSMGSLDFLQMVRIIWVISLSTERLKKGRKNLSTENCRILALLVFRVNSDTLNSVFYGIA